MHLPIKWVLFDMYDTLAISHVRERYAIENKILWKTFKQHGMKVDRQQLYERLKEIKEHYPQNKPEFHRGELIQKLAKTFGQEISLEQGETIYHTQYHTPKLQTRLAPKAKSLLKWLHARKIKCAIISNAFTSTLNKNLERLGIKEYFSEVIVSDAVGGLKSQLTPFNTFLQRHPEVQPHECLMVGDSMHEDTACQSLGIPAAIFEYSLNHYTLERIRSLKEKGTYPKYRINNLEDIKEILGSTHD